MTLLRHLPPKARFLLSIIPLLAAAWSSGVSAQGLDVPLFVSASGGTNEGFVRIVNHSESERKVQVTPFDDTGRRFDAFTVLIGPRHTMHFNSNDLELGNPGKGIPSVGTGQGDWRLEVDVDDDNDESGIEVLAYVRSNDGFLTSVHDLVPGTTNHRVPTFNPGSNTNQVSLLRIVNPGKLEAKARIIGVDDRGKVSPAVFVQIQPGGATVVSAQELESGTGPQLTGHLGDGTGKWQLFVSSSNDLQVISLMKSPTGHITNLSTSKSQEQFLPPPVARARNAP